MAGLTPVTIIKSSGTEDEQRVETKAQLLSSEQAYFAIEDPVEVGDRVEMPHLGDRSKTVVCLVAKATRYPVPENMRASMGGTGYTEVTLAQ